MSKEFSAEHARETAKVISTINPDFLAPLTLMVEPEAPIARTLKEGALTLLTPLESLAEIHTFVQNLELTDCTFRSNHASNYLPLKAHLPEEKEQLLRTIEDILNHNRTEVLRPESLRAL